MVIAPTVMAANISMADSLILMVMALVVVGPRRLPQLGRQIGKLMYEFRKASNDFKFQMEEELRVSEEADRKKKEEEERQRQLAANPPAQIEANTPASESPAVLEPTSTEYRDPYAYGYDELTEEHIRIQPPSTGEQVAAERPNASTADQQSDAAAAEPPTDTAAGSPTHEGPTTETSSSSSSSAPDNAEKTIESAAHNG